MDSVPEHSQLFYEVYYSDRVKVLTPLSRYLPSERFLVPDVCPIIRVPRSFPECLYQSVRVFYVPSFVSF